MRGSFRTSPGKGPRLLDAYACTSIYTRTGVCRKLLTTRYKMSAEDESEGKFKNVCLIIYNW